MVAFPEEKPDIPRIYVFKPDAKGEMQSMIVDVHTAVELCKEQGYELTPYAFTPEEERNEEVEIIANGFCQDLNKQLNLHLEQDKTEIVKFSRRFLNYSPNPKMSRKAMVRKVDQIARKQGKYYADNYQVVEVEEVGE